MAGESCNLNNDEAEIFKPPSSSSSSPPPPPSSSTPPAAASTSLFLQPPLQQFPPSDRLESPETPPPAVVFSSPPEPEERPQPSPSPSPNRCSSCHKRVGLAGFRCRCGVLFCGRHRYSDTHDCSFDYKTVGREQIAKDNPLIRAAKIIKI